MSQQVASNTPTPKTTVKVPSRRHGTLKGAIVALGAIWAYGLMSLFVGPTGALVGLAVIAAACVIARALIAAARGKEAARRQAASVKPGAPIPPIAAQRAWKSAPTAMGDVRPSRAARREARKRRRKAESKSGLRAWQAAAARNLEAKHLEIARLTAENANLREELAHSREVRDDAEIRSLKSEKSAQAMEDAVAKLVLSMFYDQAIATHLEKVERDDCGYLVAATICAGVSRQDLRFAPAGPGRTYLVHPKGSDEPSVVYDERRDNPALLAAHAVARGLMAVPELGAALDLTGRPNELTRVRDLPEPAFSAAYRLVNEAAGSWLQAEIARIDAKAAADAGGEGPSIWEARANNAVETAQGRVREMLGSTLSDLRKAGSIDVDAVMAAWPAREAD